MEEVGKEGSALDIDINKALYKGVPAIHRAVVKVIQQHIDRAHMFGQLSRRIEEKVLYGDSKEATDLLSRFEKDELEVSEGIKAEFSKTVEALGLTGLRGKKSKKGAANG
jgi:hypothetical protein